MYEKFNPQLEQEMLQVMVQLYRDKVRNSAAATAFQTINPQLLGEVARNSIFANQQSVMNFLNQPNPKKLSQDALYKIAYKFAENAPALNKKLAENDEAFAKNNRLFFDGLRKANTDKTYYPDASSTMRITFGNVDVLPIRNDREYHGVKEKDNYITTIDAMVAKHKPGNEEFELPQRFLDMARAKDFGQYADENGNLPINFLSDNDITGGNSGSPIMNGKGELMGLAFDGNSEALSGDIVFEEKWQKTINVDSRFVLWIIDKYAGAGHLLNEMTIVK